MDKKVELQFLGFLTTPPLWKEESVFGIPQFDPIFSFSTEDLNISQKIPSLRENFVLGKRVERFFELGIDLSEEYRMIASNIQISRKKITLGELDFILQNNKKKLFHVELVYKFYLYDPTIPEEIERWIGPNRKDSLMRKIKRLKENQLPLIFEPETKEYLNTLNIQPEDLQQEVCFKANLFLPKNYSTKELEFINPDCICGYWITFSEFSSEEFASFNFITPTKQNWPIAPENGENWMSHSEIIFEIRGFFDQQRTPLVWVKKENNIFERIFVVWW